MKQSNILIGLGALVAVLAFVVSAPGLFWQGGGSPFPATTLHGQSVQMYGQGVYAYDTLFTGAGFRGTDAVTLVIGIPLLVIALALYQRSSLRGALLLTGSLAYLLYNALHMAFSAAYNNLFLLYVAFFSAAFFALVLAFSDIDVQAFSAHISSRMPRRGIATFLFFAGTIVLLAWLSDVLGAQVQGTLPPVLGTYTTIVTYAVDLGIIAPTCFLAGILVLRRAALGYVLAFPLVMLCALIGIVVPAQTAMQIWAGWQFGMGQLVVMIGLWVVLGLFALWFVIALWRGITDMEPVPSARLRAAPA